MTLATLDPASGNQTGVWIVLALLAILAIFACLYQHERVSDRHKRTLTAHDRQLGLLASRIEGLAVWLGVELNDPVDDSPQALEAVEAVEAEAEQAADPTGSSPLDGPPTPVRASDGQQSTPDDCPTDEIPIAPATVPDGMPLAVQSALIEQRPSPVPREAEMVERTVNIGGTLQTFLIPAREDT